VNFAEPMVEKWTPVHREKEMQIQSIFLLDLTLSASPRPFKFFIIVTIFGDSIKNLLFPYHLENYTATGHGTPLIPLSRISPGPFIAILIGWPNSALVGERILSSSSWIRLCT
jgi:hypothetical protein